MFHLTDSQGISYITPSAELRASVLDELEGADEPLSDVVLIHDSGWSLTVQPGGIVVWERYGDSDEVAPCFLRGLNRLEILKLWDWLAQGRLKELQALPWQRWQG